MDSIFNNDLVEEYMRKKYGENYQQKAEQAYKDQLDTNRWAGLGSDLGDVISGKQVGSGDAYFQNLAKQKQMASDKMGEERKGLVDQYLKEKYFNAQLAEKESDRALKEMQMRMMGQEKGLDRSLKEQALAQRAEEKQAKEKELTAVQAKQLGLAEMGKKANEQYKAALAKGFDPTSYSPGDYASQIEMLPQWMKSDAGKEAMSAQASWVESYLRDASGAAIPPSERGAYAKDYFPRPGDTPEIVKNKEELRKQKEQSALVGAGPGAALFSGKNEQPKQMKKEVVKKMFSPSRNQTKIIYSDGSEEVIDGKQ